MTMELQSRCHVDSPELRYPHDYGAQPLFEVTAELTVSNFVLDTVPKRTQLRRGEFVQDVGSIGKTFNFESSVSTFSMLGLAEF